MFSSPEAKAHWWAYRIGRPVSSIRLLSTLFKHLLFRNHWADWSQISYGVSMDQGNKSLFKRSWSHDQDGHHAHIYIYWPSLPRVCLHMSNDTPWQVKLIFYSTPTAYKLTVSQACKRPMTLSTTKFIQMMILGWPWPILRQGQIWCLMLLCGKKVKQWIFQKLLLFMIWN